MLNKIEWQKTDSGYKFKYGENASGWHLEGFEIVNDKMVDLMDFYGVEIKIKPKNTETNIKIICQAYTNGTQLNRENVYFPCLEMLVPPNKDKVIAPFKLFDYKKSQPGTFKFVEGFSVEGDVETLDIRIVEAESLYLKSDCYSRCVKAGEQAQYNVTAKNCTDRDMTVSFCIEEYGWETAESELSEAHINLLSGETKNIVLSVCVTDEIVKGGHEKQVLAAIPNGDGSRAVRLEFLTGRKLSYPYIIHDEKGWDCVRGKYARFDWAKEDAQKYIDIADNWEYEIFEDKSNGICETKHSELCMNTAIAYEITGEMRYAQKCQSFIVDVFKYYPDTKQACNQALVQEGHFFQHTVMAYDIVRKAKLFTIEEDKQIENGLRIYMDIIDVELKSGHISNWLLSEMAGAVYAAMALQDLERMERFVFGMGGVTEHISKGIFDDGWWFECSLGYHLWVCSMFLQIAFAMEKFGYSILHMKVNPSYSRSVGVMKDDLYGIKNEMWGSKGKNYRNIEMLLDSMLPFMDYDGVVFAMNDAMEGKITMRRHGFYPYEIAYMMFEKPLYGDVILMSKDRDVVYGMECVTGSSEKSYIKSALAGNAGAAVLRSQTEGREAKKQIQAVIKYGSHGGYHGHFDRTSLTNLMRYGKSFYNPEIVWYGYGSFMYKFYIQNSIAHNMTVVDGKNQEAMPCEVKGFACGKDVQVFDVVNVSRWSNPPYGGMYYGPNESFSQKSLEEGRSVPKPENEPAYGELTDFTEPITQRRCTVVTDDYVLIYDYLEGEIEHTYDCMYHISGFLGIDNAEKARHMAQLDKSPLSSGQFITNCGVYKANAPAVIRFDMDFETDTNDELYRPSIEQHGHMNIDIHVISPQKTEIIAGTAPINREIRKRVKYKVFLDDNECVAGDFGAWILGTQKLDINVSGAKKLTVKLDVQTFKTFLSGTAKDRKTLYLADAFMTSANGDKIPMKSVLTSVENVYEDNRGYVIIAGEHYGNPIGINPIDYGSEAVLQFNLESIDAVSVSGILGADYPPFKDDNERKSIAIRQKGRICEFITLIEQYEGESVIEKAYCKDGRTVVVYLKDGRVQTVRFNDAGAEIV